MRPTETSPISGALVQEPKKKTVKSAVILGSGRGRQFLDASKSYPDSLIEIGPETRLLDWILDSLEGEGIATSNVVFVGGYHMEKVVRDYPGLAYQYDPNWANGELAAALAAALEATQGDVVMCSTRGIFVKEGLRRLVDVETRISAGTITESQLHRPTPAEIIFLHESERSTLIKLIQDSGGRLDSLSAVVDLLRKRSDNVTMVDLTGAYANVKDSKSISRFLFGSKAQTLERLETVLKHSRVPEQIRFEVDEWNRAETDLISNIQKKFPSGTLVVRSTSTVEDSWEASQAGKFVSVLDVDATDRSSISSAVSAVIDGYRHGGIDLARSRQDVFVQPMVSGVRISGVVLTRDLHTGGPYYVVTVDSNSGRTDTVTSGSDAELETFIVYKNHSGRIQNPLVDTILKSVKEIEKIIGHDSLDVEFAITEDQEFHLLQVRPMVAVADVEGFRDEDFHGEFHHIRTSVEDLLGSHPELLGRTSLLGSMPDWNPAEMIGNAPRPLALSLYKTLITDFAWAEARRQMGYRNLVNEPLLFSLCGKPYVDLRRSFNSFVPASLEERIATALVDAYAERLRDCPHLHDKIEFGVAVTCLSLDFDGDSRHLLDYGLTQGDLSSLRDSLRVLTENVILGKVSSIAEQYERISRMNASREAFIEVASSRPSMLPLMVRSIISDCIINGTIPFSILARCGFMAMSLLNSLVKRGIFSDGEYQAILKGVPTVASEICGALEDLASGKISREKFVLEYGHLRPGSYDILSPNYASTVEKFMVSEQHEGGAVRPVSDEENMLNSREIFFARASAIEKLLKQEGLEVSVEELFEFITAGIQGRERGKFEFTKSLNAILQFAQAFGEERGLSADEMSFVPISSITSLATESGSVASASLLRRASNFNRKRHEITRALRMPPLITSASDLEEYCIPSARPNFITDKHVSAKAVVIDESTSPETIAGCIVMIRSADPGYDWIFHYDPAGLVTEFGGAASHMAIRAAEFGLPAVIGCGALFEELVSGDALAIDCANEKITVQ